MRPGRRPKRRNGPKMDPEWAENGPKTAKNDPKGRRKRRKTEHKNGTRALPRGSLSQRRPRSGFLWPQARGLGGIAFSPSSVPSWGRLAAGRVPPRQALPGPCPRQSPPGAVPTGVGGGCRALQAVTWVVVIVRAAPRHGAPRTQDCELGEFPPVELMCGQGGAPQRAPEAGDGRCPAARRSQYGAALVVGSCDF